MEERVKKMLEQPTHPTNIQKLLDFLKKNLKQSRSVMGKNYDKWDRHLDVYKGNRAADEDDIEARENDEPEKMVVPLGFSQVQTFVSFAFLLLLQNKRFFELEPTGQEDNLIREPAEIILQRDLNHNRWPNKLYQFLLDLARMSIGVTKECWKREYGYVPVPIVQETFSFGSLTFTGPAASPYEEVLMYEGNQIVNIRPQAFLPDARLPVSRWMEGQFVADEESFHIQQLKRWEKSGRLAGVKFVERMSKDDYEKRGPSRLDNMMESFGKQKSDQDSTDFMVSLTEVQVLLIPNEYDLGPEDFQMMFMVHIANDNRIVNIERAGYIHNQFGYNVAQFSPDNQNILNESLCDVTYALQDVVTWLINSRILSVRRSLDDRLVVDPSVINMASIEAGSPVITLKSGAPRNGIERYIQQLKIVDTTTSHMQDADTLTKLMFMVTGVNENAMGQFSPGRRSATENRAANAGAASRMKVVVTNAFHEALGPMGRKMLTNSRDLMSPETFKKIIGTRDDIDLLYKSFCPGDPRQLVGSEDFFVFDSTLSSEKGFLAQSLQELMSVMMSNPETMAILPVDFGALLEEIYTLRGVTNVKRFIKAAPPAVGGPMPGSVPPGVADPTGGAGAGPVVPPVA